MAIVIVTLKIMPESPEINLDDISQQAVIKIRAFASLSEDEEVRTEQEPVAFGLKAIKIMFAMDESKGSTESLEEDIKTIQGVKSVDVVDVRRAIG